MTGQNERMSESGTSRRTAEKDPALQDETQGQASPDENVLTSSDRQGHGEDADRNPDAPQHGGYGRPV
jgi:hypothetical protein